MTVYVQYTYHAVSSPVPTPDRPDGHVHNLDAREPGDERPIALDCTPECEAFLVSQRIASRSKAVQPYRKGADGIYRPALDHRGFERPGVPPSEEQVTRMQDREDKSRIEVFEPQELDAKPVGPDADYKALYEAERTRREALETARTAPLVRPKVRRPAAARS